MIEIETIHYYRDNAYIRQNPEYNTTHHLTGSFLQERVLTPLPLKGLHSKYFYLETHYNGYKFRYQASSSVIL